MGRILWIKWIRYLHICLWSKSCRGIWVESSAEEILSFQVHILNAAFYAYICLHLYYLRKGQVFKLKAAPQTFDPLSNGGMPQHSAMRSSIWMQLGKYCPKFCLKSPGQPLAGKSRHCFFSWQRFNQKKAISTKTKTDDIFINWQSLDGFQLFLICQICFQYFLW